MTELACRKSSLRRPVKVRLTAAIATLFALGLITDVVYADPPPWAPAYGQNQKYKKHKKRKSSGVTTSAVFYPAPFGIDEGRCSRELIGGALGGAAGAALGFAVGDGDGRIAAIVGGAILGALVGGTIGRSMDQLDQNCVGQILEHAEDGRTVVWNNPDIDARYQVTPAETYRNHEGRYCREYTTSSVIAGKSQEVYGTACRQPDGSWAFGS